MTTTTTSSSAPPAESSTPPLSRSSSSSSSKNRRSPKLSLDLSDLPALSSPAPPSNTLIITNVNAPALYTAASLQQIRDLLQSHTATLGGVHTFAPLKSFRRIIVSFYTVEAALAIRQALDGESIAPDHNDGDRIRVYFGEPTPLNPTDQHLAAPASEKQFFISPPPSPPHGWEMRNEDPPNKDVHAEDLADALSRLNAKRDAIEKANAEILMDGVQTTSAPTCPALSTTTSQTPLTTTTTASTETSLGGPLHRNRSGSRSIVYHPQHHGHSPDLPAIAVEDTTLTDLDVDDGDDLMESYASQTKIMAHTARPPVELMMDA